MPGDNWMTKSETLLKESSLAIVDASGNNANVIWELGIIMNLNKKLIVIVEEGQQKSISINLSNNYKYYVYSMNSDNEWFIENLRVELAELVQYPKENENENEPIRLLSKNEYESAIISAYRLLESSLRNYRNWFLYGSIRPSTLSLSQMLRELKKSTLPQDLVYKANVNLKIRNQIVHEGPTNISKRTAADIVNSINALVDIINRKDFTID